MSENLHPSQLHHYILMYQRAKLASWGCLTSSILLLSLGSSLRGEAKQYKSWVLCASVASLAIGGQQRKTVKQLAVVLGDIESVSRLNFQFWIKTKTLPTAPMVVSVGELPKESIKYFDWNRFRTEPNTFPHLRFIGKTGSGKTTTAEWVIFDLLKTDIIIISPKRKPQDFKGYKVWGEDFNYKEAESKVLEIQKLMYQRYADMKHGINPTPLTVVIDEAKLILQNCSEAVGQAFRDFAVVARDAQIKIVGLAQGTQVKHWGLEGESDIAECFTDILIGQFALDHCISLRNKHRVGSEQYRYWETVLARQQATGKRCCMVGDEPALIPDLSNWTPGAIAPGDTANSNQGEVKPIGVTSDELLATLEYPERDIVELGLKQQGDWLPAWKCHNLNRSLRTIEVGDIRLLFLELARRGIGETECEGDRTRWRINQGHLDNL